MDSIGSKFTDPRLQTTGAPAQSVSGQKPAVQKAETGGSSSAVLNPQDKGLTDKEALVAQGQGKTDAELTDMLKERGVKGEDLAKELDKLKEDIKQAETEQKALENIALWQKLKNTPQTQQGLQMPGMQVPNTQQGQPAQAVSGTGDASKAGGNSPIDIAKDALSVVGKDKKADKAGNEAAKKEIGEAKDKAGEKKAEAGEEKVGAEKEKTETAGVKEQKTTAQAKSIDEKKTTDQNIEAFKGKIESKTKAVGDMDTKIKNDIEPSVKKADEGVKDANKNLNSANQELSTAKSDPNLHAMTTDADGNSIPDENAQSTARDHIEKAQTSLNTAKEQVESARGELEKAKETLKESKKQLEEMKKDLEGLKKEMDGLKNLSADQQKTIDSLKGQIDEASKKIESLETKVTELGTKIKDCESAIAECEKGIEAADKNIENIDAGKPDGVKAVKVSGETIVEDPGKIDVDGAMKFLEELSSKLPKNDKGDGAKQQQGTQQQGPSPEEIAQMQKIMAELPGLWEGFLKNNQNLAQLMGNNGIGTGMPGIGTGMPGMPGAGTNTFGNFNNLV